MTMPVPAGIFGPAFAVGAGFGRLVGEAVSMAYPKFVFIFILTFCCFLAELEKIRIQSSLPFMQ
jgi:H+/Cl- antiporter ClcA